MRRKLLSIILTLCMIVTLMPVSLMAEETYDALDTKEQIIAFNEDLETEIMVPVGTAADNLGLPEVLTATVKTTSEVEKLSGEDLGDWGDVTTSSAIEIKITRQIPVTWISEPEYDMNTEGEYVFTPMIEGYIVTAKLPEIIVRVGEGAAKRMLMMTGASTTVFDESKLQETIDNAEDDVTIVIGNMLRISQAIIIDDDLNKNITIDLNGNTVYGYMEEPIIQHRTQGTLTIVDSRNKGCIQNNFGNGIEITSGGTFIIESGTIEASGNYVIRNDSSIVNMRGGRFGNNISSNLTDGIINVGTGVINISGGIIDSKGYGIRNYDSSGMLNISGGATTIKGNPVALYNISPSCSDMIVTADTDYYGAYPENYNEENLSGYKYIVFEPDVGDVAQIGTKSYLSLQRAVLDAKNNDTIQLLEDINLNATVIIPTTHNISLTLDLNGKKIYSSKTAISYRGDKTFTIDDSSYGGEVRSSSNCIGLGSQEGSIVIKSGTITGDDSGIFSIANTGSVNVLGGKVISQDGRGYAIDNENNGSINISGGEVIGKLYGIYNAGIGNSTPAVNISGGLISGEFMGIYYNKSQGGNVTVSGEATIKGTYGAIDRSTNLILLEARVVKASNNFSGSPAVTFTRKEYYNYKYLEFEIAPPDATPPIGQMRFRSLTFSDFQNPVSLKGFYNYFLYVTLTGEDEDSGLKKVEYLISSENYVSEEEAKTRIDPHDWIQVDNDKSIGIEGSKKGYIYARFTDYFDNVSIIRSDGVVIYKNSKINYPNVSFTNGSDTDINVWVTFNDNTIKKITNAEYTLSDMDYAVSGSYFTLKASYLNTLPVNNQPYTFTVYYHPLGIEYPDTTLTGSEEPATNTINLPVLPKPLEITTASLPDGTQGQTYNQQLQTDSMTPVTWSIQAGALPNGLILDSTNGLITGVPMSTGFFSFRVKATDGARTATKTFLITINPPMPNPLLGLATISNSNNHPIPRIGDILTGSLIGGNNTGILSYTWKSGTSILAAGESYEVTRLDLGKPIMLEITSTKETGTAISIPTAPVIKKVPPTPPAVPTLVSKTHNSVTLTENEDYEFSIDDVTWQKDHVFTGLFPDTAYSFYQRVAETEDTECSEKSMPLVVSTDAYEEDLPDILTGTAGISNNTPRIGDVLVGLLEGGNNTGLLNYTWKADGLTLGTNESYKVTVSDLGKRIILEITSSKETGMVTSAKTQEVRKKLPPNAPAAPILISKTPNSVTLTANKDYEFSKDGITWQKNHVFSSLRANTAYTFYQRVAETDDTEGSEKSAGLNVTTNSNNNSGGSGGSVGSGSGSSSGNGNSNLVIVNPPITDKVDLPEVDNLTSSETDKPDVSKMTDVSDHWAKSDIEFVVERGLLKGMDTHSFSPDTKMTRGMFATILGRLAKADVSRYNKSRFTDVASDTYYAASIEWASQNGIVNGIGDRTFAPNQPITREQMAVMMYNYAKIMGITLVQINEELSFADSSEISEYAKEAVNIMQRAGIISGKDGNIFDPKGEATRAEVSAVLSRFIRLIEIQMDDGKLIKE